MVERQFVIVVGVPAESLDDLGRLFPRATIVSTPTLEEATRWMEGAAGAAPVHPSALTVGGLSIDVEGHVVSCGDVQLDLTEREVRLLACLASQPERAWSFEELFVGAWGQRYMHDRGTVQAAVQRLRRKLAEARTTANIEAVRGFGFRIAGTIPTPASEGVRDPRP